MQLIKNIKNYFRVQKKDEINFWSNIKKAWKKKLRDKSQWMGIKRNQINFLKNTTKKINVEGVDYEDIKRYTVKNL